MSEARMKEIIESLEHQDGVHFHFNTYRDHKNVLGTKVFGSIDGVYTNFNIYETDEPNKYRVGLFGRANHKNGFDIDVSEPDAYVKLVGKILSETKKHHADNDIKSDLIGYDETFSLGRYQFSFAGSQAEVYHLGCFLDNALQMGYGNTGWFKSASKGEAKIGLLYDEGSLIGNFYIRNNDNVLDFILEHNNNNLADKLDLYDHNLTLEDNLANILIKMKTAAGLDVTDSPKL